MLSEKTALFVECMVAEVSQFWKPYPHSAVENKISFYNSIVIDCLAIMFVILVMLVEGFQPGGLIGISICVLNAISSTSALQPHQSENEALIKFMEDLEN